MIEYKQIHGFFDLEIGFDVIQIAPFWGHGMHGCFKIDSFDHSGFG